MNMMHKNTDNIWHLPIMVWLLPVYPMWITFYIWEFRIDDDEYILGDKHSNNDFLIHMNEIYFHFP